MQWQNRDAGAGEMAESSEPPGIPDLEDKERESLEHANYWHSHIRELWFDRDPASKIRCEIDES